MVLTTIELWPFLVGLAAFTFITGNSYSYTCTHAYIGKNEQQHRVNTMHFNDISNKLQLITIIILKALNLHLIWHYIRLALLKINKSTLKNIFEKQKN